MVCFSFLFEHSERWLHDRWSGQAALYAKDVCFLPPFLLMSLYLADTIKTSVQPISQRVLTSVSFTEHRATHRPGSSDPGSRWCYCWITEGNGQQISRGLSAGRDWHCCVPQNRPNAQRRHQQSFYMQTLQNLGLFHCML